MGSDVWVTRGATTPAHDFFELMFHGADFVSSYWQPYLKSVGRWQLELAQLGAKQARASIELSHRMARAEQPGQVSDALMDYWRELNTTYEDASRNFAAAVARAAPPSVVLEMPLERPPRKRVHDTLELVDGIDGYPSDVRKVA